MKTYSTIDIGCNIHIEYESLIQNRSSQTFVLSNGFGAFGLNEPLFKGIKQKLEQYGCNYIHYLYPERQRERALFDLTISNGINYLCRVIDFLDSLNLKDYVLFGSSFGANISLEVGIQRNVSSLILVNPVIDYTKYRKMQIGKANYEEWILKGTFSFNYNETLVPLSFRFIQESKSQNLKDRISKIKSPIIAFQGLGDTILNYSDLKMVLEPNAKNQVYKLNSGHKIIDDKSINEIFNVIKKTLAIG